MFACLKHWRMLPKVFQKDILDHYRPGQEIDKKPSQEYLKATERAQMILPMIEQGFSMEQILEHFLKVEKEMQRKKAESLL